MTQESDTARVMLSHLRSRPCTRRPHFLLTGAVFSLPLWGVFLGGAALALAGVRGLLEAELQAPQLTPGGALPEAVLPATTIPSRPHVPRLMGLDAVSGESGEAASAPADEAISHGGALAHAGPTHEISRLKAALKRGARAYRNGRGGGQIANLQCVALGCSCTVSSLTAPRALIPLI